MINGINGKIPNVSDLGQKKTWCSNNKGNFTTSDCINSDYITKRIS